MCDSSSESKARLHSRCLMNGTFDFSLIIRVGENYFIIVCRNFYII